MSDVPEYQLTRRGVERRYAITLAGVGAGRQVSEPGCCGDCPRAPSCGADHAVGT